MILKELNGSIIIIGSLNEKYLSENITEVFYLNNFSGDSIDNSSISISKNIHLKDLHKYFKDGIDNIYANFEEIKNYVSDFINESLKITKKEVIINFKYKKDYELLLKKYKRYNLDIIKHELDNNYLMEIKVKKINKFKRIYYHFLDNIYALYNYIGDNI